MDELLDLREELQHTLINFRAQIATLSKDIESSSWDQDFPADVQDTFNSKVEPALQEIEDKLNSPAFEDFWNRGIVDKIGYIATTASASAGLGTAAYPFVGIGLASVLGLGAALVATGVFSNAGFSELEEKNKEIERNGLYFYYE